MKWHPIPPKWYQCPYCHRVEWSPGNNLYAKHRIFKWTPHMADHYRKEMRSPWKRFKALIGRMKFKTMKRIDL